MALRAGRIFSLLPFPLLLCDKKFSVIQANQAFTRLFQMKEDNLPGKNLFKILGGRVSLRWNGVDEGIAALPEFLSKRNPKTVVGTFPKIGKRVFRIYNRSLKGNEILLLFQDVTHDFELRQLIEKSRKELLSIFDGIEDPMVMIDKNFRIRRINEQMLATLGAKSYREFLGKACWLKLHGRTERCSGCTADTTFNTGFKTSRVGPLERRSQPDEFSYQITCYPLKDVKGEVTGVAECYRDMTEITRVKEELYESERGRVMESFAAGIAHEVRNPLAVIQSSAQFCLSEAAVNGNLRESLEAIVKSVGVANRVVNGLLNFAKPQEVFFQRQRLKPILEEGLRLAKGRAKGQKVRVKKSIANLPPLILDKARFLQAYMNFLLNALDAMPQGGRLSVGAHYDRRSRRIAILIQDTGEGVPTEMVHKIFQPFYTTKKEGLGLGLPIAEGIIRSHGGQVAFKSWPGKGSEVRINLPMARKFSRTSYE